MCIPDNSLGYISPLLTDVGLMYGTIQQHWSKENDRYLVRLIKSLWLEVINGYITLLVHKATCNNPTQYATTSPV